MKKDKLITIRVSEDLQGKFNQWLSLNRLSGAEFLRGIIENCVNGTITLDNLNLNYQIDSIDNEQVKKLETRLDELESNLSSIVSSQVSSQLELFKQSILDEIKLYSIDKLDNDSPHKSIDKIDGDSQNGNQLNLLDEIDKLDNDSQSSQSSSQQCTDTIDSIAISSHSQEIATLDSIDNNSQSIQDRQDDKNQSNLLYEIDSLDNIDNESKHDEIDKLDTTRQETNTLDSIDMDRQEDETKPDNSNIYGKNCAIAVELETVEEDEIIAPSTLETSPPINNEEIENPQPFDIPESEELLSENAPESKEKDEGIITNEKKNTELKSDSEGSILKPIKPEILEKILEIEKGQNFSTQELCDRFKITKYVLSRDKQEYSQYFSSKKQQGRGNPLIYTRI